MKKFFALLIFIQIAFAQQETIDTAMIAKIRDEGMNRSQAREILSWLTDVYGPRLTGSPAFKRAAEWTTKKFNEWQLSNVKIEGVDEFGRGWQLKKYFANVRGPQTFPLISYPKAWSPAVKENTEGEVVYLEADSLPQLMQYTGKLKGKFVLLSKPNDLKAYFTPPAMRYTDSSLLRLANADIPRRGEMNYTPPASRRDAQMLNYKKWELLMNEKVAAVLTSSPAQRNEGGSVFVMGATVPVHPDTPYTSPNRIPSYSSKAPKNLPAQIEVGNEHYNRMVRMIQKGEKLSITMTLDVEWTKEDSVYNVIAEIPGTDLKDEVVIIGGHLDSWHGGTGATDNGTGVTACMEAMRILKTIGAQPRRTIRVALWGGEEQGLLGSRAYVKKYFGEREGNTSYMQSGGKINLKPAAEKVAAYFNNDNGTGKVRGIYLQGNKSLRPIFRAWLAPFRDLGASTITVSNTGGTDHQAFDGIGLPGFQFIQDPIEYGTRTWHSTMDVWDRSQEEDMKQAAVLMAAFAYNAAMRDEKLPRRPIMPSAKPVESKGFEDEWGCGHDHVH